MNTLEKLSYIVGLILFAAVLVIAFRAYLGPAMLFDFATLQICS